MYFRLLESYVWWLETHGRSKLTARTVAAFAFTIEAQLNSTSAAVFGQVMSGIPILTWLGHHAWLAWVMLFAYLAIHVLLCRRVAPAPDVTTDVWWKWYASTTFVLFVTAAMVDLANRASQKI